MRLIQGRMENMYQISQLVVYGSHGVCRIVDTEERVIDRKTVSYFVLEPLAQPGTNYLIPSQSPTALAKIRPLLEKEQMLEILQTTVNRQDWLPDDNRRKQLYRQILSAGDVTALLGMLRTLQTYKEHQQSIGKRLHICDDNFMRDAYKLLSGEICVLLHISESEARVYLDSSVK